MKHIHLQNGYIFEDFTPAMRNGDRGVDIHPNHLRPIPADQLQRRTVSTADIQKQFPLEIVGSDSICIHQGSMFLFLGQPIEGVCLKSTSFPRFPLKSKTLGGRGVLCRSQ